MQRDVVIIGGGPAGLCTAIELALAGIKVLVCEGQSFPIDKPCGEGIMPYGVHHLHRLGVMTHLDKSQTTSFDGISFINQRGSKATMRFKNHKGMGIRRNALSQALYARALDFKNISFLPERIHALKYQGQKIYVQSKNTEISTRLIIGADGLRSAVRGWANREDKNRSLKRYGLRKHFCIKPWSSQVEVYFASGVEAYVTPCGPEQTNIAFLWEKHRVIKPSFETLINIFPLLRDRLVAKKSLSEERAYGPLQQRCKSPIAFGIALVGDASGYLDAITGEGNSIAMACAQALAPIVAQALSTHKNIISEKELQPYAKAHRAIVGHYYRNTKIMLFLARYPTVMENFIEWGAFCPRAFSWVIAQSRAVQERELSRQLIGKSLEVSSG